MPREDTELSSDSNVPRRLSEEAIRTEIAEGEDMVREVLAFRAEQRLKRARAIEAAGPDASRPSLVLSASIVASLGPRKPVAHLIAEGDSWFDYPFNDIVKKLENEHGYEIASVAHRGDTIENMAYEPGQLEDFCRHLEKMLRNNDVPRAILLSGGGNDIAGREFGMLLNHAKSSIAGLNEEIITGVIDVRLQLAYCRIIGNIEAVCQAYLQRPIPILMHGYDFPVPDGRGFLGGLWFLPGPWLRPGFSEKGFDDLIANTATMQHLIARFNKMIKGLATRFDFIHFVDLEGTLHNELSTYHDDWDNELHPSPDGFGLIANRFAKVLEQLT